MSDLPSFDEMVKMDENQLDDLNEQIRELEG